MTAALIINQLRVLLVCAVIVRTRRVLELGDGVGGPHVVFATHAEGVFAACFQRIRQHWVVAKGCPMRAQGFFGHFKNTDTLDGAGGTGEVFVD